MPAARKPVRLLIVGTGGMAGNHAENFAAMPGVTLWGGVDTNPERLAAFCDRFAIANRFTSIDAALADGGFDAVTNVTPDAAHHATTMPFLKAGKHVLCEKPLATEYGPAAEMTAAAQAAGVVNMVNFTYRKVLALEAARAMVARGAIGTVRHFEASYLQSWLTQPAWGDWKTETQWLWRLSGAHGSKGVLGDVGVHILDFATYVAGDRVESVSCRLKTFDKAPGGRIGDYVLDANDSFVMHLGMAGGAVGVVHASRFASGHLNDLKLSIFGDKGGLEVAFENNVSRLRACLEPNLKSAQWRTIRTPRVPSVYDRFIAAIRGSGDGTPDFARGAELQQVLDLAVESDAKGGLSLSVG
jgi:predicted dehydrogenase